MVLRKNSKFENKWEVYFLSMCPEDILTSTILCIRTTSEVIHQGALNTVELLL